MEILAENTLYGPHIIALALTFLFGALFWLFLVCGIASISTEGVDGPGDYIALLFITAVALLMTIAFVFGIKEGPEVTYDATITDFNEVYEQGYEIVEQRGKIFVIKERE